MHMQTYQIKQNVILFGTNFWILKHHSFWDGGSMQKIQNDKYYETYVVLHKDLQN
jgi:hypothetical protein